MSYRYRAKKFLRNYARHATAATRRAPRRESRVNVSAGLTVPVCASGVSQRAQCARPGCRCEGCGGRVSPGDRPERVPKALANEQRSDREDRPTSRGDVRGVADWRHDWRRPRRAARVARRCAFPALSTRRRILLNTSLIYSQNPLPTTSNIPHAKASRTTITTRRHIFDIGSSFVAAVQTEHMRQSMHLGS